MLVYKVEIFDGKNHTFKDVFMREIEVVEDYLSPQNFVIDAPPDIAVEYGNTVRVSEGTKEYCFVVREVEYTKIATSITVCSPIIWFDNISVQNNRTPWHTQLYYQVFYDYQQSTPSLFKLPVSFINGGSVWGTVESPHNNELISTLDCLIDAAKIYGVFLSFKVRVDSDHLGEVGIVYKGKPARKTAEIHLGNVFNKQIVKSNLTNPNIAQMWYPAATDDYRHYDAVLIDGAIIEGGSRKNEIEIPVIRSVKLDAEPTQEERTKFFTEALQPEADGYCIKLQISKSDRIFEGWEIGQAYTLIDGDKHYDTMLTGYRITGEICELTFGTARLNLTDKL